MHQILRLPSQSQLLQVCDQYFSVLTSSLNLWSECSELAPPPFFFNGNAVTVASPPRKLEGNPPAVQPNMPEIPPSILPGAPNYIHVSKLKFLSN
jgi:hypothetical protein